MWSGPAETSSFNKTPPSQAVESFNPTPDPGVCDSDEIITSDAGMLGNVCFGTAVKIQQIF